MFPEPPALTRRSLLTGLLLASVTVPLALDALPGALTTTTAAQAAATSTDYTAIVGLL